MYTYIYAYLHAQTVYNTKGTRAHTHRELIREWLWEPKGSSLEYTHRHTHTSIYWFADLDMHSHPSGTKERRVHLCALG